MRKSSRQLVKCGGREAGLTLVEMLVTLGIFGLVSWIVARSILIGLELSEQGSERVKMQQFGQLFVAELVEGIRETDYLCVDTDCRGLLFRVNDGSLYYYFDSGSGKLRKVLHILSEPAMSTVLNPPDIEVIDCSFIDRGNTVQLDLCLRSSGYTSNRRAIYRLETDVSVPNRT